MKTKIYTLCLAFLGLAHIAKAQSAEAESSSLIATATEREYKQTTPSLSKRPITIYAEGFGHAFNHISFNFDTRFKKQVHGLGWRAGLAYSFQYTYPLWSLPVGLNYLLGRQRHFFELGAGVTPWLLLGDRYDSVVYGQGEPRHVVYVRETQFRVFGNTTIGYRYQPPKSGLSFGLGFSPIFRLDDASFAGSLLFPYLRVGYTF